MKTNKSSHAHSDCTWSQLKNLHVFVMKYKIVMLYLEQYNEKEPCEHFHPVWQCRWNWKPLLLPWPCSPPSCKDLQKIGRCPPILFLLVLEAPVPISSAKRTVSSTGADLEFCKRGMGDYSMIVHLFMHYLFVIIRLSVALGENSGWSTACRPDVFPRVTVLTETVTRNGL